MTQTPSFTATKTTSPTPAVSHRVRTVFAASLGVIAVWLILSSIMSVWLNRTFTDTNTYVNTVSPLATSPAVQEFITQRVTETILDAAPPTDLAGLLLTPAQTAGKSEAELKQALQPLVQSNVSQVVHSTQFSTLWRSTNQVVHQDFIRQVNSNASELTLNLHPTIVGIVAELNTTRLAPITNDLQIKPDTGVLHIKNDTNLRQAHNYYNTIKKGTIVVIILAAAATAGAIALSVHHAKTIRRILMSTGMTTLALAIVLQVPSFFSFNGPNAVSERAAVALEHTLLHGLQVACLIIGIVCIGGALTSKLVAAKLHKS